MKTILALETSCDETAAAILRGGFRHSGPERQSGAELLASEVASQVSEHEKYGGVVPEVASRNHLLHAPRLLERVARIARIDLANVDAFAATSGPGLASSLMIGASIAKGLSIGFGKPYLAINHLEGHLLSPFLVASASSRSLSEDHRQPPSRVDLGTPGNADATIPLNVSLIVSGGHTMSVLVRGIGDYEVIGRTVDDAAGEAFDKVAKLLALGYPGGPVIDRLARHGNPHASKFGRVRMKGNQLDFSFSGLKTAVLYRVRGTPLTVEAEERRAWRSASPDEVSLEALRAHCSQTTLDIVASFQEAVVTDLIERTLAAATTTGIQTIFVSGGVACNSQLRERFAKAGEEHGFSVFSPSPLLSTDNAAMIAAAGYYKLATGHRDNASLNAHASFPLGNNLA
jgi:tRNA N6-adenosine threonylcarbamoyltransferase